MKIALLLVLIAAVAGPSFCWRVPNVAVNAWSQATKYVSNAAKAIVERAKADLEKVLSEGNKEKAAKLINDSVQRIKKVLEFFRSLTQRIPGLNEKVDEAVAKATAALKELKTKAQEAVTQENIQKVRAALEDALAKAISKINDILKPLDA